MKQNVIVMLARRYGFTDDDKRRVEGVSLTYFDAEQEPNGGGERRGLDLLTISGDLANFDRLHEVPGLYELQFTQKPGKGGRPSLALAGLTFVEPVSFSAEG